MSDEYTPWEVVEYEGFEIHATPYPKDLQASEASGKSARCTYIGFVCHPGVDPKLPGHSVPFHADGDESFATAEDALYEATRVGRSIIDGTHPDLSVLSLVTGGT